MNLQFSYCFHSDKDFTNVTLACKYGKQIYVHKVIMGTTSPFSLIYLIKDITIHLYILKELT